MFFTIAVVITLLWILGLSTSFMMGGAIHVLLLAAVVGIFLRAICQQKPI